MPIRLGYPDPRRWSEGPEQRTGDRRAALSASVSPANWQLR